MSDAMVKTLLMLKQHQVALSSCLHHWETGAQPAAHPSDEIRAIIQLIGEQRQILEPYRFGAATPQAVVAQCEALAKVMAASVECIARCSFGMVDGIDGRDRRFTKE
jgi:hypothetical protein